MLNEMPEEIDFTCATRGLHYVPKGARVLVPASIEESVWNYFSKQAVQKGVDVSELLTEALRRQIEVSEASR